MTTFLDLLAERPPLLGTWIKLPTIESVELMALAGFDFVVIDLEHSPISLETAATQIAVARGRGICPLVRVPDHAPSWIQRCLDAGAAGILAPHVDTVEQARNIGRAARFEPRGTRGVGPTSRAGDWGLTPMDAYLDGADQVSVIAQIESSTGADAAPEILDAGTVDALFVGPVDLSVSVGMTADDPAVTTLIDHVLHSCRSAGVPCGTAIGADADRAAALAKDGFSFVMVSNDATILGAGAAGLVDAFRRDSSTGW
ncbi:aldolase/citrate lyase family protein (plasmid) [Rhodococcus opacus]|uniref:HpcH/HpaI aldolase family protein n=1 Tax=Rhodococcus opacus TaxID=37919 RepID=UPI001FF56563|nr:aldolase/citrate lyase family protein [Rhodococcus opacus]UOT08502.1 aldolase/citrate lyase family protein [Rhodococcus opacus]